MIKQLRYLCTLLLLAVVSGAWADEVEFTYSNFTGGTQSSGSPISFSNDYVTFAESKGYANTSFVNLYASGVITITPKNGATVTNVVITTISSSYNGYQSNGSITASSGSVSGSGTTVTWTGSATDEFTLTHNKQIRMTKVVITYTTGGTPTCATPTFSPAAGTYPEAQNVTIGTTTEGATIYYTMGDNPADPTTSSTQYTGAINVSTTTTIKAIAVKSGNNNSAVASANYTIKTPSTIADVREQGTGDVFTKGVVTSCVGTTGYIQDATAAICVYGASLTVGDEITVSGTLSTYNGLLEITNPNVTVLSQNKTVTPTVKTIEEINTDYAGNNELQGWLVKIENATVTAIDGSNTTIAQGSNTIVVRSISGVEYKVNDVFESLTGNIGCFNAVQIVNPTDVTVEQSTIPTCATPTFTPEAGTYTEAQNVTINSTTSGATIYYTTDGSTPTTSSSVYSSAINVATTTTIKAMAVKDGMTNSEVAEATYTINLPYTGAPYVRVTDLNSLTDGAEVIIAARHNSTATSYYAMTAATTSKPTGVAFTSETSANGEKLPTSIVNNEDVYSWTVGVTTNGYTFTNANGQALGYTSGTNFATNGNNTEWVVERETSGSSAMVSDYEGFYIRNYNTINASTVRGIALNNQNNYGPYATNNNNSSDYNFYLDIFVKGATSVVTPSISADNVNITADATGGEIAFTVNNGVTGGLISASTTDTWIRLGNQTTSPISFSCDANTETTTRTATVTLTYAYGNEHVTKNVTITQAAYVPTYTVMFELNGGTFVANDDFASASVTKEAGKYTLPSATKTGNSFEGWSDGTTTYAAGSQYQLSGDVTFTAQWTEVGNEQWVLTDLADLTASDVFVIVGDNGNTYAMSNGNGAQNPPVVVAVTIEGNYITSTVNANIKWNVSGNAADGYTFYPDGTTETWLYCNTNAATSSNNNMRVGTGDRKVFELDDDNYLITKDDFAVRYLSIYNNQDWRGYINTSNGAVPLSFYKKVVAPGTETITVKAGFPATTFSCNKDLDFTEVEGVKAYIITDAEGTTVEVNKVPANTGLYLEVTATDDENAQEFSVPVITEDPTAATEFDDVTDNLLIATDGTSVQSDNETTYYAYGKQKGEFGFFKVSATKPYTPSANKALLAIPTAQAKDFILVNGGATGINAIEAQQTENGTIYNLAGQRVNKAQKGIYIVNGHKVVIR